MSVVDSRQTLRPAIVIGALGVVFGDIGTSPIYTLQTVFNPDDPHPVPVTTDNVFGVVSLIFWSVMIIVTVTYVLLAMRADNDGEGGDHGADHAAAPLDRHATQAASRDGAGRAGTLRRLAVLRRQHDHPGDLGAVRGRGPQGRRAVAADLVVPITAVIIIVLFLVQRRGTAAVGRLFGPVMIVWFVVDRRVRRRSASSSTPGS